MLAIKAKNSQGDLINLSLDPRYTVFKVDGLTPQKANISKTAIATKNRSIINSTNVEDRNIVIYIKLNEDIEQSRNNLYKYFTTGDKVRVYLATSSKNVYTDGYVESFECDIFSQSEVAQISIVCESPYFFDVMLQSNINVTPFNYSDSDRSIWKYMINNIGDVPVGFEFNIKNLSDTLNSACPFVTNEASGEKINLVLNKYVTIGFCSEYGNEYVFYGNGDYATEKAMSYITFDSSWIKLMPGENIICVTMKKADNYKGTPFMKYSYRALYTGI